MDGWALTMLSRENVGYASTCNSIGQTLGFFISQVGFLALYDADVCNKYFRWVFANFCAKLRSSRDKATVLRTSHEQSLLTLPCSCARCSLLRKVGTLGSWYGDALHFSAILGGGVSGDNGLRVFFQA